MTDQAILTGDIRVFALLLLISAVLARGMIGIGIMDMPGGRKTHPQPTPRAGGIGPIGACLGIFLLFPMDWTSPAPMVLAASGFLGLVGLVDDLRGVGVAGKLAAQAIAAGAVASLSPWPGGEWGVAWVIPAAFWLVFITNVFNFMDGLNGLAAGAGMLAATILALVAPPGGMVQPCALALAAGLAGFLPFNFPRARLFLGDTGSQFCGFLLGALGLMLVGETGAADAFWLAPMLLAGMMADVGVTLIRRARAGADITAAHREHAYQRAPLPAWGIALAHWGFVVLGGLAWGLIHAGVWPVIVAFGAIHVAWLRFVQIRVAARRSPSPAPGVRNHSRSW